MTAIATRSALQRLAGPLQARAGMAWVALGVGACALLLGSAALWFWGGRSLGWTKTSIMTTRIEPVTGLEERVWEKRFVPGVDFLGGAILVVAVLFCTSFLVRKNNH